MLAVPLWDPLAARPGSDDAVCPCIKGADGVLTAVGVGGMSAAGAADGVVHPDGKWCVGTLMTTIVLTDLLGHEFCF